MSFDPQVYEVLEESQRLGFLGGRDVSEVIDHARAFVRALSGIDGVVVDLGSGGGVPGLVIAHDRPDLELFLVDRRAKRTDFLDRVVRRLRWNDRVSVLCVDASALGSHVPAVDALVARGFGPPMETLAIGASAVRHGGRIVISEPPSGDRWVDEAIAGLGVSRVDDVDDPVAIFVRSSDPVV